MPFVEFTDKENNVPVYVRSEHIVYMQPINDMTVVVLSTGGLLEVAEDVTTVLNLIDNAEGD